MSLLQLLKFILVILTLIILSSCKSAYLLDVGDSKKIDSRLVGIWYGSEKDQQEEGVSRKWVMKRNKDASFVIDFESSFEGDTVKTRETGNWWVKDNKFYEFHQESDFTDVYTYKVLNTNEVKFKLAKTDRDPASQEYEFIDTRLIKYANHAIDTAAYRNAIKVNSIPEEYAYVKEICKGCEFKGQALRFIDGKPYDILTLQNTDGKIVSYYFDISSFYGIKK